MVDLSLPTPSPLAWFSGSRRTAAVGATAAMLLAGCSSSAPVEPSAATPVTVATARHTPFNLSASGRGGLIAVGWNDYDEDAAVEHPYVAVSSDQGATFGAPVTVDANDPFVAYPEVAVTERGDVFVGVTLYEKDEGDGRAGLYRSQDRGATYSLIADLTEAPRVSFADNGTSIAVSPDGKTVVMSWLAPTEGDQPWSLVGVVSVDGGTTFGKAVVLSADAGAARPFAYAGAEGAGVVAISNVPIPNAPKPTPAVPNPVTSWQQVTTYPVDGSAFGPGVAVTSQSDEALDAGPAGLATGTRAWWQKSGTTAAFTVRLGSAASGVPLATSFARPAPIEAAISGQDTWFLSANIPPGDSVPTAPLVLSRSAAGAPTQVVTAVSPVVSRSADDYALAGLDAGVLLVWFEKGAVRAQAVRT